MPSDDIDRLNGERTPQMSRRRWLGALGLAGAAGMAGCSGGDGDGTATGTDPGTSGSTPTMTPTPTEAEGFGEETTEEQTTTQVETLPEIAGQYRTAVSSSYTTFNPIYSTEAGEGAVIGYTAYPSYRFKPGQIQFPLQLEMSSEGGEVWECKLRENLQWSDPYGQVTAEDWVYNITKVHQTEWSGSSLTADWYMDEEPIPVEKTGKYTFEITIPDPDPLFPKKRPMWGHDVVPKDLIKPYVENEDQEGLKQDEDLVNLNYTGNLGPYKLTDWQRQKKVVLERNEDFFLREVDGIKKAFEKAPYFESLEVPVIKESSSRLGALKSGEIDSASVPPNEAAAFKDRDDTYLNIAPQPYNVPLFYNQRGNGWELTRKKGVRQALGCAIDKKKYVQGVFRGYAAPEYTWQPKWSPWYDAGQVVKYGTGDLYGPEVTKEKMREALSDTDYGYSGGQLMNPEGEQVEVNLLYQSSQQTEVNTAQFIKQEFSKNAGIKVNIEGIGATKFTEDYWYTYLPDDKSPEDVEWHNGVTNAGPRDVATSNEPWDMALVYGLNTFPMTPTTNQFFFSKDSYYNPYGYYPTYDFSSLFDQATSATSQDEIKSVLAEIFGKISKDQPMGMLALNSEITGYRTGLVGPEEEFFNGWDFPTWRYESQEQ